MRDFERTAEPRGEPSPKAKPGFSFVIQKHAARNLHYDFRLELDGVLLSWAVPKGPSLDPSVKRLAMEVEPHPLEYGGFEGTIPKGDYGGGTVMVWDRGTWQPEGDPHQGLRKGHLSFSLQGQKLKGAWHLVRTHRVADDGHGNKEGKGWLLFKSRDAEASDADKLLEAKPNSALTGRNLEEIAAEAEPKGAKPAAKLRKRESGRASKLPATVSSKLPATVSPELATLVDAAPAGDDWVHEIKLDGYRILARLDNREVTLLTRNGKDWTERMPTLRAALAELDVDHALLDGELVALNDKGISDFQELQNSLKDGQDGALVYYAFDLLHDAEGDLTELPLVERKSRLRELLEDNSESLAGRVRFSAHVVGSGPEFFANAAKLGLEGTVAKRAASPYRSGRGRDWLKIKAGQRQEFTIVGYTAPGGSRSHFGALLLGTRRDGELTYAGKVGTGFSAASLADLHARLGPLARSKPAVSNPPTGADARGVKWVEPSLVAEIAFTELTHEGLLRHPTFQGLRDDKPAREVVLETPQRALAKRAPAKPAAAKTATAKRAPARAATTKATTAKSASRKARPEYPLTNPDKVLYPDQGITKRELLDYYAMVADRMLPHVANRPLTLVRCPNGCGKPCFFQKHPGNSKMPGLREIAIREKEGKSPYNVLDDERGLFDLVQLGVLEIHTWGSHADDFEHPDILVFDLDPDPSVGYQAVIDGAHAIREIFEQAKLETFVKTTGGKGLHVCVPIAPDLSWAQAKDFTERLSRSIAARSPELYVATQTKAKRKGKTFIDYLRNGRGATFIAPYSTRARETAPIAVPLEWDELSPKLPPHHFHLRNIESRLKNLRTDPFERLSQLEQRLQPEKAKP
jgi:bifunctional non-homologous end joining protein LigD